MSLRNPKEPLARHRACRWAKERELHGPSRRASPDALDLAMGRRRWVLTYQSQLCAKRRAGQFPK